MRVGKKFIRWTGLVGLVLLTGCPLATQPPAKRSTLPTPPAGSAIVPNTKVNPVVSISSELLDPFVYTDTVQSQAPNTITLSVNDNFQSLVANYIRVKFPQTADLSAPSPDDAPRIAIRLTYLDFHPRWAMGNTFMVDATIDLKVDVKLGKTLHEQELHASGQGKRDAAFKDSLNTALRNAIPVLNRYVSSLNL